MKYAHSAMFRAASAERLEKERANLVQVQLVLEAK